MQQYRLNRTGRNLLAYAAGKAAVLMGLLLCSPQLMAEDASVLEDLRFSVGDESTNEKKALQAELLVRKSEDQALAQLQSLLKKHRGQALEVELLFRLAELHMRRAKTERFFEIHRHSETVTKLAPSQVKKASQKREIEKAISTYSTIRNRFPKYQQLDLVLFNDGFARQLINDDRGAEKSYWEIISKYPNSYLIPDAHLAIGEINFEKRQFQKALDHFLKIEGYPASRAYSYGMYKAAWSYYNLQNAQDAIKKLEKVVEYGRYVKDNDLDSRLDLRNEALKDLALFYSDVMPPKGAVSYFIKQSRELDAWPFISILAEIYKRHGKYADVEVVLRDVIKMIPDPMAVIAAHNELLLTHERALQREKAVERLSLFVKYCKGLTPKKNAPEETVAVYDECRDKVVESSHQLASKWHGLWLKNNKHELFQKSATLAYTAYLEFADPKTEEMAQVRFNFGELLYNAKEFRKASESYALVRTALPSNQLRHDGNYSAIVSLEKAVGDKWNDKDEAHFQQLVKIYLEDDPKGQYALDLKFKVAFVAYQKGRYAEAQPQFHAIGWEHKGTEKGERAQDLYLDILNINKNFTELKTAAAEVEKMTTDADRKKKIKTIYQEAYFAEIQVEQEKGQGDVAADNFIKFASENPTSRLASKAWWNATQLLFASGRYREGAGRCVEFATKFPKDENVKECLGLAARHYEQMGQLVGAASALEKVAELSEGQEKRKVLELAADFWALTGDGQKADKLYDKVATLVSEKEMGPLLEKWHVMAQDLGLKSRESFLRGKIMALSTHPYRYELLATQVESEWKAGKMSEAFKTAGEIVGSKSAPAHLKAKARYHQALVLKDEFERQSVKARPERVAMVLALKTDKLEKAQKAFQAVIAYKDPTYSSKALEGLAQIYITYADHLRKMDLPSDFTDGEREQFKAELENLAIPMEEKGIEGVLQALKFTKDVKLRDSAVLHLQNWLNELNHQPTLPNPEAIRPEAYFPRGGEA